MFFGVSLLTTANLLALSNYLMDVLPPSPSDPVGIFDRPLKKYYDYIVVGAGTAGGIVAGRLSEDPCSVLVLEAGGSDLKNEITQIPLLFGAVQSPKFGLTWDYTSVRQTHAFFAKNNQTTDIKAGKVLGGTDSMSAINLIRGNRQDYDDWEKEGAEGWGFEDVLPYFKKLENVQIPELRKSKFFGKKGPFKVRSADATKLKFFHRKAAEELGIPCNPSCNGKKQIGFCPMQITTSDDGKRSNSMNNYLRPALKRDNLQVSINSVVTKVLIQDGVARGVKVYRDGQWYNIYAKKEVILSAGVIGSPKILLLSGVGPRPQLESLNIPIQADLPVGENLQDQMLLTLQYSVNTSLNINKENRFSAKNVLDYILCGEGIFKTNGGDGNIFIKLKNYYSNNEYPDGQLVFGGFTYEDSQILASNFKPEVVKELMGRTTLDGFTALLWLLHPRSRGYVRLACTNPFKPPLIDPNYLGNPEDVYSFVRVIREVRKLETTKAWRSIGAKLVRHDLKCHCSELPYDSISYWKCMVHHFASTGSHLVGTCRMGSYHDPRSVVDPALRVIGIRNLRVVDASVIPSLTSGLINGVVMMIAEKASDIIKHHRNNRVYNEAPDHNFDY